MFLKNTPASRISFRSSYTMGKIRSRRGVTSPQKKVPEAAARCGDTSTTHENLTMSRVFAQNVSSQHETRAASIRHFTSAAFPGNRALMRSQPFLQKKRLAQIRVRAEKVVGIDLGTTNSAVSISHLSRFSSRRTCEYRDQVRSRRVTHTSFFSLVGSGNGRR